MSGPRPIQLPHSAEHPLVGQACECCLKPGKPVQRGKFCLQSHTDREGRAGSCWVLDSQWLQSDAGDTAAPEVASSDTAHPPVRAHLHCGQQRACSSLSRHGRGDPLMPDPHPKSTSLIWPQALDAESLQVGPTHCPHLREGASEPRTGKSSCRWHSKSQAGLALEPRSPDARSSSSHKPCSP